MESPSLAHQAAYAIALYRLRKLFLCYTYAKLHGSIPRTLLHTCPNNPQRVCSEGLSALKQAGNALSAF